MLVFGSLGHRNDYFDHTKPVTVEAQFIELLKNLERQAADANVVFMGTTTPYSIQTDSKSLVRLDVQAQQLRLVIDCMNADQSGSVKDPSEITADEHTAQ